VAKGFLSALGLASIGAFIRVITSKPFEARTGPQTDISKAQQALCRGKRLLFLAAVFWAATIVTYFKAYTTLKGKGCDARFTASGQNWVRNFVLVGIVFLVVCVVEAIFFINFQQHDRRARAVPRPEAPVS
jgi:hypothetical protein